jgi:diacylglycerol kinase (ATP)
MSDSFIHYIVCYYHVHEDCQDLAVNDCRNCATYIPNQEVPVLYHHWREGGVPPGWKCVMCNKDCGTTECLSSVHCSWCKRPAHSGCSDHIEQECDMGLLRNLALPHHCCSLPEIKLSTDTTSHELRCDLDRQGSKGSEDELDSSML